MKTIFIILCIAIIIYSLYSRSKIDREEKVALRTPGTADKLRSNYSNLINMLLSSPSHSILMERKYDESIRIGNLSGQELFVSFSALGGPQIHVACIEQGRVIKEWTFKRNNTSDDAIFHEISNFFK